MKYVIETKDITKKFGELVALNKINLKVKKGEIFGLLGPNGAGKSTLFKILVGLLLPTSGTATIDGKDLIKEIVKIKEVIGYLPENVYFYDNLTARQNLNFFADLSGADKSKIDGLLDLVGLKKWADTKVGNFSHGMQKRLGIAQALIRDPEIIFFDEPTNGLDPEGKKDFREIILKINSKGKTIILSSHILSELEHVCDRIGTINHGELIACDTPDNLTKHFFGKEFKILLEVNNINLATNVLKHIKDMKYRVEKGKIIVSSKYDKRAEIYKRFSSNPKLNIQTLVLKKPSLEEIYLKLVEAS